MDAAATMKMTQRIGRHGQLEKCQVSRVDPQDNLVWTHKAFEEGGIEELRRLNQTERTVMTDDLLAAWEKINDGLQESDDSKVWDGNIKLLNREQFDIVVENYRKLEKLPQVTIEMSKGALSGVPDGKGFQQHFQELGNTNANVANDSDRWDWIEKQWWNLWKVLSPEERVRLAGKTIQDLKERKFDDP